MLQHLLWKNGSAQMGKVTFTSVFDLCPVRVSQKGGWTGGSPFLSGKPLSTEYWVQSTQYKVDARTVTQ